jgi:hypothetical protein
MRSMVSKYSRVRVTSGALFVFIKNVAETHDLGGCFSYRLLPVAFRTLHDALGIATCLRNDATGVSHRLV